MSSFICSAKHFNSIEESLANKFLYDRSFSCYQLKKGFGTLYKSRDMPEGAIKKEIKGIVDGLRDLNIICVTLQYKHHFESVDQEIASQQMIMSTDKSYKLLPEAALFKALVCVRYQIETVHLENLGGLSAAQERALAFLDIMINALAYDIARKTSS